MFTIAGGGRLWMDPGLLADYATLVLIPAAMLSTAAIAVLSFLAQAREMEAPGANWSQRQRLADEAISTSLVSLMAILALALYLLVPEDSQKTAAGALALGGFATTLISTAILADSVYKCVTLRGTR